MPSISGIAMSLMITSNDLSRAAFAASRPSPAVTTVNPAVPSVRAYARAIAGSSSTIRSRPRLGASIATGSGPGAASVGPEGGPPELEASIAALTSAGFEES